MDASGANPAVADGSERRDIRVLIVDDSPVCRDLLVDLLSRAGGLCVAGTAADGCEAVARVAELRPDIVTMDLRMPVMDGIEATRAIMERHPTPILVLTGHPFQSGRDMTFEALEAGALDLMIKPELGNMSEVERLSGELTGLIRYLAAQPAAGSEPREIPGPGVAGDRDLAVVAIASSAGGPRAVHRLLVGLPETFRAGVVIVQHIAEGFSADFARWLDEESPLQVRLAEDSDEIQPGVVLVAPDDAHVRAMPGGRVRLFPGAPIGGYRPSADVLLTSIARQYRERACGIILSGMGEDGVSGLEEIHSLGGLTIAQDAGTCVVHGMPAAAVDRGVVDLVLPPERIASELRRLSARGAGAEQA